jgi:para-aminobenzoate synthetase component 1
MPSTFSTCLERRSFNRLAARLITGSTPDLATDAVLSVPGHPAATTPLLGIGPVRDLVFRPTTTPGEIKDFCFATPGPALGFVSYGYGLLLRGVASAKTGDFPLGHLKKYAAVAEYDDAMGRVTVTGAEPAVDRVRRMLADTAGQRDRSGPAVGLDPAAAGVSLDQSGYEAGVRATLARIRAGDVYQLNLSTRLTFHSPGLNAAALFLGLWRTRPAPFYAYFASGPHRVVSTSPERFVRVHDGLVLSQPIKGTLRLDPGMPDPVDQELVDRLTGSPKEDAELSMIVDLIRNDIAARCEWGSVRVSGHKSVFRVDDLLQMYSNVTGTLRRDSDCLDLFLDAFPGGSVTGCPKGSAMEIIEALEPHSRDIFCGSMVVVRGERDMDSSVAIRTAVCDTRTGSVDLWAGSGIVVDSDPMREYQETMAKAAKFLTPEAS